MMRLTRYLISAAVALAANSAGAVLVIVDRVPTHEMSSIVFLTPHGNAAYLAQRSHAWRSYRQDADPQRRLGLIRAPAAGSRMAGASARQAQLRDHLTRATAYRLRYFDK